MILGIMGGMGPAATADLFKKIIEFTSVSKDQEHIHIVIDSNTDIADRSEYILGLGKDPTYEMVRSAIKLEAMGADYIVIPCNTAHYFYDRLLPYVKVPILHMIRETAVYLKNAYHDLTDFILFATEGTYISRVYETVFANYNLNVVVPDDDDKKMIMNWIYGVKAGDFSVASAQVESLVKRYSMCRNIPVILGCTELPLLAERLNMSDRFVDPVAILAKRCIDIVKMEK
jgi:aspartate racemase